MQVSVEKYLSSCRRDNKLVVVAKNVLRLSDLTEKNGIIVGNTGLLFDIWNEIARVNNYRYKTSPFALRNITYL
jgi:hypothetical protein